MIRTVRIGTRERKEICYQWQSRETSAEVKNTVTEQLTFEFLKNSASLRKWSLFGGKQ